MAIKHTLPTASCNICGYSWVLRTPKPPDRCNHPKCRSRRWNDPTARPSRRRQAQRG